MSRTGTGCFRPKADLPQGQVQRRLSRRTWLCSASRRIDCLRRPQLRNFACVHALSPGLDISNRCRTEHALCRAYSRDYTMRFCQHPLYSFRSWTRKNLTSPLYTRKRKPGLLFRSSALGRPPAAFRHLPRFYKSASFPKYRVGHCPPRAGWSTEQRQPSIAAFDLSAGRTSYAFDTDLARPGLHYSSSPKRTSHGY